MTDPGITIGFRRLTADDLPTVHDWLGREHVARWWGDRGGYEQTVAEYLPAIEGNDPSDVYAIVVAGERAVGMIQTYLLADYPEWAVVVGEGDGVAGLDLFIGEEALLGHGLGTDVIRTFASELVFARAATSACVADPDIDNVASIRAFEKAGFSRVGQFVDPEDGKQHALMRLERPVG